MSFYGTVNEKDSENAVFVKFVRFVPLSVEVVRHFLKNTEQKTALEEPEWNGTRYVVLADA